jgi:hypothetical protein
MSSKRLHFITSTPKVMDGTIPHCAHHGKLNGCYHGHHCTPMPGDCLHHAAALIFNASTLPGGHHTRQRTLRTCPVPVSRWSIAQLLATTHQALLLVTTRTYSPHDLLCGEGPLTALHQTIGSVPPPWNLDTPRWDVRPLPEAVICQTGDVQ